MDNRILSNQAWQRVWFAKMAALEQNVNVLRAAANNEDIIENVLRDIDDEEALAELSETGEFSGQATVF